MESKELTIAINKHLFVPVSDDLVTNLQVVIENYVTELTSELVTKYAKAIFNNQVDWNFRNVIQIKYEELFGSSLIIPNIIYLILEGYTLKQMILSDLVDVNSKAKFSLIVRNCAVIRKGDWNGIVCSKWLIYTYEYYGEFCKNKVINNVEYDSLLKAVVSKTQWEDTCLEIENKSIYEQIRSLCASGIRGKLNCYTKSQEFVNISSPYTKAYLLAKKMVKEYSWKYISESPVNKLRNALGENAKKRKQLGKIIAEMTAEIDKEQLVKPSEGSSILLSCIIDGGGEMNEKMFSALEFGIYVYYEFQLESFNN